MARFNSLFCASSSFILVILSVLERSDAQWRDAHATFYRDSGDVGTMSGACGYHDTVHEGYGLETTAISYALFNNGSMCGACYEIRCVNDPQWCIPGAGTITVTATNSCPPSTGPEAWCNPPNEHFILTMPMFLKLARYKAGIVPVQYRRFPCNRQGGVKFEMGGNPNFITVLVYNVAGEADVTGVQIKGNGDWITMARHWGQIWQTGTDLVGQNLSFKLTTSDGKSVEFDNVADAGWQFGQSFEATAAATTTTITTTTTTTTTTLATTTANEATTAPATATATATAAAAAIATATPATAATATATAAAAAAATATMTPTII